MQARNQFHIFVFIVCERMGGELGDGQGPPQPKMERGIPQGVEDGGSPQPKMERGIPQHLRICTSAVVY